MTPEFLTSPLNTTGAITEITHMVHGRRFWEVLPDVQVEIDTAENSAVQDVVDAMESEEAE